MLDIQQHYAQMKVTVFELPVDSDDLRQVALMLKRARAFTASFEESGVDIYDPSLYLQEQDAYSTETILHLDRNVFTRILGVARGEALTDPHRCAAGILGFAQCLQMQVEPAHALYEVAHLQGSEVAVDELSLFRRADVTQPSEWIDLALGRSSNLVTMPAKGLVGTNDLVADFGMPLRSWRRNYVLCLKLAQLALEEGNSERRLREFLRWAHSDFILSATAISLAVHYLAPNSPRRGLLKNLYSNNRLRALQGVRNAAWDCTLIGQFLEAIESQDSKNKFTLLTSLDSGVHSLARTLLDTTGMRSSTQEVLHANIGILWKDHAVSSRIAAELQSLYAAINDPLRAVNSGEERQPIDDLIARGESAVFDWRHSPRDS